MALTRTKKVVAKARGASKSAKLITASIGLSAVMATAVPACQGAYVDTSTLPAYAQGSPAPVIQPATYDPIDRGDGVGAFRTNCTRSHYAWADPIVNPGKPGESHLHMFFGNTAMYADTDTPRSPANGKTPASTCEGGTANLTGYWTPAMLTEGGKVVDAANVRDAIQAYYKTTHYDGVSARDVQPFPPGLKMIAGNAKGDQLDTRRIWWSCQPPYFGSWRADGSPVKLGRIPTSCPAGHAVQLSVEFPQCWDGKNLDSADHKSHMSYGLGWPDRGCGNNSDGTPKVALPAITEHIRWRSDGRTDLWYMSSDQMGSDVSTRQTPGTSAHADWWNGWDPEIMDGVVERCLVPALDCQMNLLADGRKDPNGVPRGGTMLGFDPNAGARSPSTRSVSPSVEPDPPDARVPGE